jgi:hypothetical protein
MHKLVDKKFSVEHPYSVYTASVFETRNVVLDSYIAKNAKGKWEELTISKFNEEDSKKIKAEFAFNAFHKS